MRTYRPRGRNKTPNTHMLRTLALFNLIFFFFTYAHIQAEREEQDTEYTHDSDTRFIFLRDSTSGEEVPLSQVSHFLFCVFFFKRGSFCLSLMCLTFFFLFFWFCRRNIHKSLRDWWVVQ